MLVEIIRDLNAVSHFKEIMSSCDSFDSCECHPRQQAASYVVSLLHTVQPEMLQQILGWQASDWHDTLTDAASRICLLRQASLRRDASGAPIPFEATVDQQLCQVGAV